MFASSVRRTVWPKYVRDVAVPLVFARPWWEACLRGAVRVAGERDHWWYHVICLLLLRGQTVWHSAIGICAALVGSAFAWRRATGEREPCWRKRGVSLVSGIVVVSRVSQKSAPRELPTRVSHKSVLQDGVSLVRGMIGGVM